MIKKNYDLSKPGRNELIVQKDPKTGIIMMGLNKTIVKTLEEAWNFLLYILQPKDEQH
jgi:hypothetical protein